MSKLEDVIKSRYGVDSLECDAITVEWAADFLSSSVGPEKAGKAWSRLNSKRRKLGKHTTHPGFHHALYAPYFGK